MKRTVKTVSLPVGAREALAGLYDIEGFTLSAAVTTWVADWIRHETDGAFSHLKYSEIDKETPTAISLSDDLIDAIEERAEACDMSANKWMTLCLNELPIK